MSQNLGSLILLCAQVLGHLEIINFPFVPNEKLIIFMCSKIWAHYSLIIMCLTIGTPKNYHFLFGTNENVVVLVVPILKHFRVDSFRKLLFLYDIIVIHWITLCHEII